MKKRLLYIVGLGWLLSTGVAIAQPRISNVRFELMDKLKAIEIRYDVFGIKIADSIYVAVTGKTSGNIIPRALSGAVGRGVKPGSNRKIYWDVVADSLKINEEIEIQVLLKLSEAFTLAVRDTSKRAIKPIVKKDRRSLNGRALLLLGGGLAAGGGLYYASTLQKVKAAETYELYKIRNWNHKADLALLGTDAELQRRLAASLEQADTDFKKAKRQQTMANVMLIGGIAIAVADAFFTIPALFSKNNNSVNLHFEASPWGLNSVGVAIKF